MRIPSVSMMIPARTAFFLFFCSVGLSGRILLSCLYLFSIDCPIETPIATPIAGPIPMNPGFSVMIDSGMPIPENMAMQMAIHMPMKCPSG